MPLGAGVYDDACTRARESTKARSVILMVLDGEHGHGFSAQSEDPMFALQIPHLLAELAIKLEADIKLKEDSELTKQ